MFITYYTDTGRVKGFSQAEENAIASATASNVNYISAPDDWDGDTGSWKVENGALVAYDNSTEVAETNSRGQRADLLEMTDWWAMSDRTMTSEQTAYRQALRDITTHANWPNLADSDWPTKPS
jgi:hypothetical protein